jgi:hypothetical protein
MTDTFDKKDFFAWCAKHGLHKPEEIARYFRLSGQTIRNWDKDIKKGTETALRLASWVGLATGLYDASAGKDGKIVPSDIDAMTFEELEKWRNLHGFSTYESTANAFSIKRQAVHLWHKRQTIPPWVALACAGYNFRKQAQV